MKIWKKIILGFILVILIMMAVDYNALRNNIQIIDQVDELELSKRVELNQSNKIAYVIQKITSNLRELFLELREEKRLGEIQMAKEVVDSSFKALDISLATLIESTHVGLELSGEKEEEEMELAIIDSLKNMLVHFTTSVDSILGLEGESRFDEAELLFEEHTEPLSREIQTLIEDMVTRAEKEVEWAIKKLNAQVDRAILLGIYLTILSILLALSIGFYISGTISKPINKLIAGTNEIGKGNYEANVELKTKGEVQLLADSFNNMAKELKTKITAINDLNKELVEANNTKNTFFSIIAHDLKNPFNIILGYADLLTTQYNDFDEEKRKKFIGEINKASKATYELLENLLAWARSQSGKIILNKENLNLATLIEKSVEGYKANARQKKINIYNKVLKELSIEADSFTMYIVIANCINNAIKFTPNGGSITIDTMAENDQLVLSIKDTGVGMSKKTIEKIASSHSIESTPGTDNEKGTGFGLVLMKEFIQKNGGKMEVKSKKGKGSEFRFILPGPISHQQYPS